MKRTVAEQMTLLRRVLTKARDLRPTSDVQTWEKARAEIDEALEQPLLTAPWGEIAAGKITPIESWQSKRLPLRRGK